MSTIPRAETKGEGHETKDADVISIALIAIGLLLVVLLVQLTVWITMRHLRLSRATKEQGNAWNVEPGNLFPEPRLRIDSAQDLAKLRARDSHELETFGWVDRKAGVVRIPIERAIQLIAERGLPDIGQNQTPLSLLQARPGAKAVPEKHRSRY